MNLPEENSCLEKAKAIILPVSFELPTCHGIGASKGPDKIILASNELDYFDCELECEPYLVGIHTAKLKKIGKKEHNEIIREILDSYSASEYKNKFKIILGSDHSTTEGVIKAIENEIKDDFGVIIFDAHADLREPWGKDTWWHACVSRGISKNHKILIAGVRTMDFYEQEFLKTKDGKNVNILKAQELISSRNSSFDFQDCKLFDQELKKLPKNIFISIDIDVFDPSIIRCTNTPEPSGLNWIQLNNLLKKIFVSKNVIGVDITEFAPKINDHCNFSESYTLAKLIYKIIGYKYCLKSTK